MKWKIQSDLKLVFLIMYKQILQMAFIDELLGMVKAEFVKGICPMIQLDKGVFYGGVIEFDDHFMKVWKKWETKTKELEGSKKMKSFHQTKKGQRINAKEVKWPEKEQEPSKNDDSSEEDKDDQEMEKVKQAKENLKNRFKK